MPDHSCQVQRHTLSERKDDMYETPACATEALLRVERLPFGVWEPACGRGSISKVLQDAGHLVCSTDLVNYGFGITPIDFLMERKAPLVATAVCTNPPFKLGHEFVRHALELCPRAYTLHRLAFYESDRRSDILDSGMLRRVYCFRKRLPMMHREGWEGRKANSGMAFAWFVWDRENRGPTEIRRISWNETTKSPAKHGAGRHHTTKDTGISALISDHEERI